VGVMAEVFKRPSLVGLEIAWRWAVGLTFGALLWHFGWAALERAGIDVGLSLRGLAGLTLFRPVEAVAALDAVIALLVPVVWPVLRWWAPGFLAAWVAGFVGGRVAILRRLERGHGRCVGMLVTSAALRVAALLGVTLLWVLACRWTIGVAILAPTARHEEPSVVLAFAMIVTTTLMLFMLWCVVSWVWRVAPVAAMAGGCGLVDSVRAVSRSGGLRSKLMEINLVMGIVKVALLVLALVFSACPLPFETVETQAFLMWWWAGVALLWVVASDYFHVVRAAAYVRLWQAYEGSD